MHGGRRWDGRKDMLVTHVYNEFISIKLYAHRLVFIVESFSVYSYNRLWTLSFSTFLSHRMIFSVFDNYRQTIEIDEIYYDLELADTAGQVDYEQVRLVSN